MRRQHVFQAFSVPGTETLQKLMSLGPQAASGLYFQQQLIELYKEHNIGRNFGRLFSRG